jgi:hypothetical protein
MIAQAGMRPKECPLWVKGTKNGEPIRKSLGNRSLEVAIERANQEANAGTVGEKGAIGATVYDGYDAILVQCSYPAQWLRDSGGKPPLRCSWMERCSNSPL